MRPIVIYRAFPEAITEVKQPVPIAHIILLSDSYQVIGEYPDRSPSTSPQDYNARDEVVRTGRSVRVIFQL